MSPDVVVAVPELERRGLLKPEAAARILRVARGELVSIRSELRVALYAGVLLIVAGASLLIKENLERIGPLGIALGLGVVAAAALLWVARRAAPFSWGRQSSPHLAFDYLLLLGALLAAADLAYLEWKFTPLGEQWPYHLLAVAISYAVLAVRYDSRLLASLALSTFAAWRGVAVSLPAWERWGASSAAEVRWNALACGVAFALLGWVLQRFDKKAHFEPVAIHLGCLLALAALFSGSVSGAPGSRSWLPWTLVLLAAGAGLAVGAFSRRRFGLFALGVFGAYAAGSRLALHAAGSSELFGCFWFAASALLVIAGLVVAQRAMRKLQRSA